MQEPDLKKSCPRSRNVSALADPPQPSEKTVVLAWDGTQFHYASAFRIDPVDTTGAGDIFHAAFIYALLQGWPLPRQLDFACAAAALNCTALGARAGIQPVAAIEHLIATAPRHADAYEPSSLTLKNHLNLLDSE